jgi:hypothetical protein
MRVLAVVDGELTGADERDERALLEALVAANGPDRPEVHVMVLVHGARPVIVVGNPPYPPIAVMSGQDRAGASGVNPAESARQRLARALAYLGGLGVRASGDIEPGKACRSVRRAAAAGRYGRILLLMGSRSSWKSRMATRLMAARLRLSVNVPVDAPVRTDLAPLGV